MQLPKEIENGIERIVSSEGLELVHVEFKPQGGGHLLRVDIDKDGGVTIDDCELIAHQLSAWLDVEDFNSARYELQVSSPGLDRKFYKLSDYEKFLSRLVRVKTKDAVLGLHVVVGRLASFDGVAIVVIDEKAKKKPEYRIELANIKEARLEVEI